MLGPERFAINFCEVGKNTDYHGRVVSQRNVAKLTELGYEIVTTPVYVRTGVGEYSYLMEIPEKKFKEGQETKQLKNDLLTYDVTGQIGKNLDKFTKPREAIAANEAVDNIPVGKFVVKRVKKIFNK
jgi:hypothetical protein